MESQLLSPGPLASQECSETCFWHGTARRVGTKSSQNLRLEQKHFLMMLCALQSNFWNPNYVNKVFVWPLSPLSVPNLINNSYFHLQIFSRALLRLLVCLFLALHLLTAVSSSSAYSGCSLENQEVILFPQIGFSVDRSVKFLKTKREVTVSFHPTWHTHPLWATMGLTHWLPPKTSRDTRTCSLIPRYNQSSLGKAARKTLMCIKRSRRAGCILDNSSQRKKIYIISNGWKCVGKLLE